MKELLKKKKILLVKYCKTTFVLTAFLKVLQAFKCKGQGIIKGLQNLTGFLFKSLFPQPYHRVIAKFCLHSQYYSTILQSCLCTYICLVNVCNFLKNTTYMF